MIYKFAFYLLTLLLLLITNPALYKPEVTAFIFCEEGCDWSQSINKQFVDGVIGRYDIRIGYHTKAGTWLFRVKNRIHIFRQTFRAGNVHTYTCQCIVLINLAFSAITIFAKQARRNYLLTGGGMKIVRAAFRGIHKSATNDNKKHCPTPSFICSLNKNVWVCTRKYLFPKNRGEGQNVFYSIGEH